MPGFVACLAVFAALSAGLSITVPGVEMLGSVAGEESSMAGLKSSAVAPVERTAAGVNSTALVRMRSSGDEDQGAGRTLCPGRCRCEVDGLLHRVDCSDLGLRDIPSNLSVFTSYL